MNDPMNMTDVPDIRPTVDCESWTSRLPNVPRAAGQPTVRSMTTGMAVVISVVLGSTLVGCSCSRQPEWDSGLVRHELPSSQKGGTEVGGQAADRGDAGSGDGTGAGGGGHGGDGSGTGQGGIADGTGRGGQGDGGNGQSGGEGKGDADGTVPGGQPVTGVGSGPSGGTGDDAALPAAALPGRPMAKPRYTATEASAVAERQLERAEASRRKRDIATAYDEALEAFEAVAPHAATDDHCNALLTRARRLLSDLAERQNRTTSPRPVPTLFE